jgi:hypothetical protein
MADKLEDLCGRISFAEAKKVGIKIEEGDVAEAKGAEGMCLVWKVWMDKNVNKEVFKSVLSTIWYIAGGEVQGIQG